MNFLRKKLNNLREQSEEVRLRAITRLTVIAGIVLVIIWLAIFLPLQLSLRQKSTPEASAQPEGDSRVVQPTISPRVTATPTAAQIPSSAVELLPSNEDQVSPTPTL